MFLSCPGGTVGLCQMLFLSVHIRHIRMWRIFAHQYTQAEKMKVGRFDQMCSCSSTGREFSNKAKKAKIHYKSTVLLSILLLWQIK